MEIYKSKKIQDWISRDGEEFSIFVGLEPKYIEQVKKYSLDESDVELQKNTGDMSRFGKGSYEEWYAKGRTPFCLIHKNTDTLAALIWLGPKPIGAKSPKFGKEKPYEIQDEWHTIAFRSYIPFRGKGVMKSFSQIAMDYYQKEHPKARFWIGSDSQNQGMIALEKALGFTESIEFSDLSLNWLVMVK